MVKRKLGEVEQITKLLCDDFCGSSTMYHYTRIEGPLDEELVKKALYWSQKKYPYLQCTFTHEKNSDMLSRKAYLKSSKIEKFNKLPVYAKKRIGENDWKSLCNEWDTFDFSQCNYLWKMYLLQDGEVNDIIIVCHHAIADGSSLMYFIKNFLVCCSSFYKKYFNPETYVTEPFLAPLEKLLNPDYRINQFNELTICSQNNIALKALDETAKRKHLSHLRHQQYYEKIEIKEFEKIKLYCRTNGISINSFLAALLLNSLSNSYGGSGTVDFCAPFNLRPYLKEFKNKDLFGPFVGDIKTRICLDETLDNLEFNKKFKNEMTRGINDYLCNFKQNKQKDAIVEPIDYIGISNLGLVDVSRYYDPFRVKEMFIGCHCVTGLNKLRLYAITLEDTVYLNFSYVESKLSKAAMKNIIERFKNLIKRYVGSLENGDSNMQPVKCISIS